MLMQNVASIQKDVAILLNETGIGIYSFCWCRKFQLAFSFASIMFMVFHHS